MDPHFHNGAACGETLSEVIRRALRCYVERGYERTVGTRHDGRFVQYRRGHYQLGLDIDPRPVRDMASSDFTELALVV